MLKKQKTTKLPTGYALKKRLLNLEYQTKIVGLGQKDKKSQLTGKASTGDYRIILLRTSKLAGINLSAKSLSSSANSVQPKLIIKRIKKTVFNTIDGIKNVRYGLATTSSQNNRLINKLPVSYIYTISPPATNLKEQYEHLALLAPYLPLNTLSQGSASSKAKFTPNNNAAGFIGCLIASPHSTSDTESQLVFYYPSQLKLWLSHLAESSHPDSSEPTNPLNGLAELFHVLDHSVFTLLTQVNSTLIPIPLLTNLASLKSEKA